MLSVELTLGTPQHDLMVQAALVAATRQRWAITHPCHAEGTTRNAAMAPSVAPNVWPTCTASQDLEGMLPCVTLVLPAMILLVK